MIFKQNRKRFMATDNLVFMGCCVGAILLFACVDMLSVSKMYIWALMIYSSFILLAPEDVSKTCVEKKMICFSLCVLGGAILEIMKA